MYISTVTQKYREVEVRVDGGAWYVETMTMQLNKNDLITKLRTCIRRTCVFFRSLIIAARITRLYVAAAVLYYTCSCI